MEACDINKLFATKVMGWHEETENYQYMWAPGHITYLLGPWWVDAGGNVKFLITDFDPYHRIEHSMMAWEKGPPECDSFCLYKYGSGWAIGKIRHDILRNKPIAEADTPSAAIAEAIKSALESNYEHNSKD